jgi:hypothetical protein
MKDEEIRRNVLSTKTTDAVLAFVQLECKSTGNTPSTQLHEICEAARQAKIKKRVKAP